MTDRSVWDEEIPVPERMIRYIDQGVIDSKAPSAPIPTQGMLAQPLAQNSHQEPLFMGYQKAAHRTGRGLPR